MRKRFHLITEAALFTLLLPGVVTLLVPYLILGGSVIGFRPHLSVIHVLAALPGVTGGATLPHCIWAFAFSLKSCGQGDTAADCDPFALLSIFSYLEPMAGVFAEEMSFVRPR